MTPLTELCEYTLRRIQSGMGLVAVTHIMYFAEGIPVQDFVESLLDMQSFSMYDGFNQSFRKVKTTDQLYNLIIYWADVYQEGWS